MHDKIAYLLQQVSDGLGRALPVLLGVYVVRGLCGATAASFNGWCWLGWYRMCMLDSATVMTEPIERCNVQQMPGNKQHSSSWTSHAGSISVS